MTLELMLEKDKGQTGEIWGTVMLNGNMILSVQPTLREVKSELLKVIGDFHGVEIGGGEIDFAEIWIN